MINNISYNSFSNPQFGAKWVSTNKVATHKRQGANMLDELIKNMVEELRVKAKDVPEFGKFDVVWSEFENKDTAINATRCILKISPVEYVGAETERFLKLAAVKSDSPYGAERVLGFGTTKEVVDKLNERGIEQIIKEKFIKLAKDLEDV